MEESEYWDWDKMLILFLNAAWNLIVYYSWNKILLEVMI